MIDDWKAHRRQLFKRTWPYFVPLVALQAVVIFDVATRNWLGAAVWTLFLGYHVWRLVLKVAGDPAQNSSTLKVEDMTREQAFWLDPATAFRRVAGREKRRVGA